jgi:cytoskeleton protein RodZ
MAETQELKPGVDLQAAREARGISAHQLAVELHISDAMVLALEKGDYAVLGQPVFVRGHLRNYARALGLPEADVLANYESIQQKPTPPPLMTIPHTGRIDARTREWSTRMFSAVVVVVLVVLAIAWFMRRPETAATDTVSTAPAATTVVPAAATVPMNALTDLADNASPAAKPAPKPAASAPLSVAAATPKTDSAAAVRAPKPAPAVSRAAPQAQQVTVGPGDSRDLTHVKFILGAASWIEVYDDAGKRLYYDLAPAGSNLEMSGAGPLQVFLGNAPGVSIELEGTPFDLKPFLRTDNTARFKLGSPAKPQ